MTNPTPSQCLGLFVRASAGLCTVEANSYNLYEQTRKGHSFSSNVNYWMSPGANPIRVCLIPPLPVPELTRPEVELFLSSGNDDVGIIIHAPSPTEPTSEEVIRRSDQSIEKLILTYDVNLVQPPIGGWLSEPQPWISSQPSEARDEILALYRRIEAAFIAADKGAILELAHARLAFVARRMQQPGDLARMRFESDVTGVISAGSSIQRCVDPSTQLRLFPARRGLVYRIEWASGLSAIHTAPDNKGLQQGFQIYVAKVQGRWCWII